MMNHAVIYFICLLQFPNISAHESTLSLQRFIQTSSISLYSGDMDMPMPRKLTETDSSGSESTTATRYE